MLPVYCQRTEVARPNLAHDKNTYFSDMNTTVQYIHSNANLPNA